MWKPVFLFQWMVVASLAAHECVSQAFTPHPPFQHRFFAVPLRGGAEENPLDGNELTSTLARLDQQWKIQQRVAPNRSRWNKLTLEDDDDYVYLMEPSSIRPSCLIVFVGGAGLGQYPHIAYNEFLVRLCDRLNAAILAVPYQLGIDHFALAKQSGDRLRRAILNCEDERDYPEQLPTYTLAHSLGCKLQTIYMAATGQEYEGVGFLSYNNFGLGNTISMVRTLARQLQTQGTFQNSRMGNDEVLDNIFSFAENVLKMVGLDFSPNPSDTQRLVEMKYTPDLQEKTRLFVFDDDTLDTSQEFVNTCVGEGPSVSGLPGTHLTPVYFKFGLDDLDLPMEAREVAEQATGGFKSASFGDEDNLNILVDEVCDWILGKEPKRGPQWQGQYPEPLKIAGGSEEET